MTKDDCVQLSGENPVYDTAVPQGWFDTVKKLGIQAGDYVWSYGGTPSEPQTLGGSPVHVGTYLLRAVRKGNLIPSDILPNIVEMAQSGKSLDEIRECVKLHCESL